MQPRPGADLNLDIRENEWNFKKKANRIGTERSGRKRKGNGAERRHGSYRRRSTAPSGELFQPCSMRCRCNCPYGWRRGRQFARRWIWCRSWWWWCQSPSNGSDRRRSIECRWGRYLQWSCSWAGPTFPQRNHPRRKWRDIFSATLEHETVEMVLIIVVPVTKILKILGSCNSAICTARCNLT